MARGTLHSIIRTSARPLKTWTRPPSGKSRTPWIRGKCSSARKSSSDRTVAARLDGPANSSLLGNIVSGAFTPVLAKHSKNFSIVDSLAIGVDWIQRNFDPPRQQVERWRSSQITDEQAKLVIPHGQKSRAIWLHAYDLVGNVSEQRSDDEVRPLILGVYLATFLYYGAAGFWGARRSGHSGDGIRIGALTALVGMRLVIAIFAAVDNIFLDTVSKQVDKIRGFQLHSEYRSMRCSPQKIRPSCK